MAPQCGHMVNPPSRNRSTGKNATAINFHRCPQDLHQQQCKKCGRLESAILGKEGDYIMASKIGDESKLKELILYISQKCASDPLFGATKLNKILYFSDFFAYGNSGRAITEVEYRALPNGPAPRRLVQVRDEMVAKRELAVESRVLVGGRTQARTVALRKPNLEGFTGREIAQVDQVIELLSGKGAKGSSWLSHRYVGFKMTKEGDNIPYGTIFLSDEPLSEAEILYGRGLAARLGLLDEAA